MGNATEDVTEGRLPKETEERTTRARIPALEAEIADLRHQLEGSHRVQAQLRTELAVTQRIVRSILNGLAGAPE